MAKISVRLNKKEEKLFNEYARMMDTPVSSLLKQALEEKIEEEFDLKLVQEYEKRKEKDQLELVDHGELKKELRL